MRRSRSAVVSDSSCLKSARYVSLKCQNEVDCSKLFSNASHTWFTFLRSWTVSSRVSSSCMLHRLLPQVWGPTASPQESGLPWRSLPFTAWRPSTRLPCQLLSSSFPDTSPLGPTAWFLQLDGPFRTTKENWMRDISATIEDSNLTFGMHWGMLRQCPLVMAYRGRTNRNWIIEVTMCCPERTK